MKRAYIVTGLGFGDEGKGRLTEHLVRSKGAGLVVRHNGGPQAAHNVITPDGRHHTFSQFGCGTFHGIPTHLGPKMMINPSYIFAEAEHLEARGVHRPFSLLSIDSQAPLITPFHVAMNKVREIARGRASMHGTCAHGVGERRSEDHRVSLRPSLTAEDMGGNYLHDSLRAVQRSIRSDADAIISGVDDAHLRDHLIELALPLNDPDEVEDFAVVCRQLSDMARISWGYPDVEAPEVVVFEGAQGVLLDQELGFHPHTTWSDTTGRWARDMIPDNVEVTEYGVTRAYATRHGFGPFPTRDQLLTQLMYEPFNIDEGWQGTFWCGHTDLVLLRYAAAKTDIDVLAITHADVVEGLDHAKICVGYTDRDGKHLSHLTTTVSAEELRTFTPRYVTVDPAAICSTIAGHFSLPVIVSDADRGPWMTISERSLEAVR